MNESNTAQSKPQRSNSACAESLTTAPPAITQSAAAR